MRRKLAPLVTRNLFSVRWGLRRQHGITRAGRLNSRRYHTSRRNGYLQNRNQRIERWGIVRMRHRRNQITQQPLTINFARSFAQSNDDNTDIEAKAIVEKPGMIKKIWGKIGDALHHYWIGTKLLVLNVMTATKILYRVLQGHTLRRRQRRTLILTTVDLFRLVPLIPFVIIPFMEFLLPVVLKLFPNMLPSTFEDKLQKEEKMKKQIALKLEMAKFFCTTIEEMARQKEDSDKFGKDFVSFMKQVRNGDAVNPVEIRRYAKLFKDDFTLDNLDRSLLVSMCKFLNLTPYGTNGFLRWQIRNTMNRLKEDDTMIHTEGLKTLTFEELQQACLARGMRATGISKAILSKQMAEWLVMSVDDEIPLTIMLLSRAFMLTANPTADALKETLSLLPDDVVEEIELRMENASGGSDRDLELEVLRHRREKLQEDADQESETIEDINETVPPEEVIPPSVSELADAVSMLSAQSPLKAEVEKLEVVRTDIDNLSLVGSSTKEGSRAQKLKDRLTQNLENIVGQIEKELTECNTEVSAKMHLIDDDADGIFPTDDVKLAVQYLKEKPDEAEMEKLLEHFDTNKDGFVSITDVEKLRKRTAAMKDNSTS
eukprot:TRINITY_DN2505_c0_g1_i1.p1 TRINITY_DN2505_c0_g1~~TRINITY_DN2505_c0_g1_i1.p1  ORF type:complete len:601 (+),score=111.47 TRINITY_DN2505_c0_g1_i1:1399-3201(+)